MKRRKLTKLEKRASFFLLEEAAKVLESPTDYPLEAGYYRGTHIRRWTAYDKQDLGHYWHCLETRDGSEGQWLSIGFDRPRSGKPTKTWRVSVWLKDIVQSTDDIERLHIAKEGYTLAHGQYLIADKTDSQWRITASEYD